MFDASSNGAFDDIQVRISHSVRDVWTEQFNQFHPGVAWTPLVNMYQLQDRIDVCIDLAGIQPQTLKIEVTAGRLVVSGTRLAPDPRPSTNESMRLVFMEIDHGKFARTISLPERVDFNAMHTEYAQGLFWIRLSLQPAG